MQAEKRIKHFPFKINTVGDSGEFFGYASTWDNVDQGNDAMVEGAFRKSLLETDGGKVPILDHHDPARQVGWNLEAREDHRGLHVHGRLDLNVQVARERHSLMRMAAEVGTSTGLSIGFQLVRAERDKNRPGVRLLREVKLLEYSIVLFPMNPLAAVDAVKTRDPKLRQYLRRELGMSEFHAEHVERKILGLMEFPEETPETLTEEALLASMDSTLARLKENIHSLTKGEKR